MCLLGLTASKVLMSMVLLSSIGMLAWELWSASSPPLVSCPAPWSQQRFPCWTCGWFPNLICTNHCFVELTRRQSQKTLLSCLTLHPGDYTQVFRHMSAPVRTSLRKLFAEHGKAAKQTACIDMDNLQVFYKLNQSCFSRSCTFNHRIDSAGGSIACPWNNACKILYIVYVYLLYIDILICTCFTVCNRFFLFLLLQISDLNHLLLQRYRHRHSPRDTGKTTRAK